MCFPAPCRVFLFHPNIRHPFFIVTQLPTAQDRLHGYLHFCKEMINNRKTENKEEAKFGGKVQFVLFKSRNEQLLHPPFLPNLFLWYCCGIAVTKTWKPLAAWLLSKAINNLKNLKSLIISFLFQCYEKEGKVKHLIFNK